MNESSIFPRVADNEIGRTSDWFDLGGWLLGTGRIVASFHLPGTTPWHIDALNIEWWVTDTRTPSFVNVVNVAYFMLPSLQSVCPIITANHSTLYCWHIV